MVTFCGKACLLRSSDTPSEWRSSRIIPGGISEYILVPEGNLLNDPLLLPDDISYENAVLIEPLACVVKSLKRSRIRKGDSVLIIGWA